MIEQHGQHRRRQRDGALLGLGPHEPAAFQLSRVKRHARVVVPKDFHRVGATTSET